MGVDLTLMISHWREITGEVPLVSDQLFLTREPVLFKEDIKPVAKPITSAGIEIEHEDGAMEQIKEDSTFGKPLTFISSADCKVLAWRAKSLHNRLALLYAAGFPEDRKIYLYWH